ncbi:RNA-binding S4 domain-containing protein [Clostridiaceae bacterium OttesenSCG-928-D20]|nr:RNA-binding S4 domain-containing protein [Clostridiaceae bacterium OttesenSCG-928-D20]
MRIDKYLKVSRLIKRRTVANEACIAGRISVNGKVVKPSYEVKIGDIISLRFGDRELNIEVLALKEHVSKDEAGAMYCEALPRN